MLRASGDNFSGISVKAALANEASPRCWSSLVVASPVAATINKPSPENHATTNEKRAHIPQPRKSDQSSDVTAHDNKRFDAIYTCNRRARYEQRRSGYPGCRDKSTNLIHADGAIICR